MYFNSEKPKLLISYEIFKVSLTSGNYRLGGEKLDLEEIIGLFVKDSSQSGDRGIGCEPWKITGYDRYIHLICSLIN